MTGNMNKDIVVRFIKEVWNEDRIDLLDEFLAANYYDYSYEPRNREGLKQTLEVMQMAFPGHETALEEVVAEGDTVAVCLTLRGCHLGSFRGRPASGKQIEIGGYRFYKLRDGKIVSHRALLDLPALLQQIS